MELREIEERLAQKNVKPTANRISIYRVLSMSDRPQGLMDLERVLQTIDKSVIFRTLMLFQKNDVVHTIDDGSGSLKYELCHHTGGVESHDDLHVHFFCEICQQTTCLDDVLIPHIKLPNGFVMHSSNYVVKGICSSCSSTSARACS